MEYDLLPIESQEATILETADLGTIPPSILELRELCSYDMTPLFQALAIESHGAEGIQPHVFKICDQLTNNAGEMLEIPMVEGL